MNTYKCDYCQDTKEVAASSSKYIDCPSCTSQKININSNNPENNENLINPDYYKPGNLQVIEVIEGYKLGFHIGNSVKYVLRAGKKTANPIEDLKKAKWYLDRYLYNRAFKDGLYKINPVDLNTKIIFQEFDLDSKYQTILVYILSDNVTSEYNLIQASQWLEIIINGMEAL